MMKRTIRSVLAMSLGLCLMASAARAEDEMVANPAYTSWASHKAGTLVTSEMNTSVAGQTMKTEMAQKLVELTPEKAVVEVSIKLNLPGVPAPAPQKQEIPAKVKASDAKPGKLPEGVKGEVKETGTEKVEVAGKTYECKVTEFTGEQNGSKTTGKTWTSDKIPGTLAKMETTGNAAGQETKMTMTVLKIETK